VPSTHLERFNRGGVLMPAPTAPAPEIVHVDVCGPGMLCIRAACARPARLWLQRDGDVRLHYCPADAGPRLRVHWRQGRRVEVTNAAKALLDEVAA
jgi:hypothetical protein